MIDGSRTACTYGDLIRSRQQINVCHDDDSATATAAAGRDTAAAATAYKQDIDRRIAENIERPALRERMRVIIPVTRNDAAGTDRSADRNASGFRIGTETQDDNTGAAAAAGADICIRITAAAATAAAETVRTVDSRLNDGGTVSSAGTASADTADGHVSFTRKRVSATTAAAVYDSVERRGRPCPAVARRAVRIGYMICGCALASGTATSAAETIPIRRRRT